jgi:hypothetical protein
MGERERGAIGDTIGEIESIGEEPSSMGIGFE